MGVPVKEAADLFGVTAARLKQIVKEEGLDIERESNGYIRLPFSTVRQVLSARSYRFRKNAATFGLEKGGTGKSTITINTALAGARKGAQVLVIDLDPEACATQFLAREDFEIKNAGTILEVITNDRQILDYTEQSRFDGVDFLPCRSRSRRVDDHVLNENPATLLRDKMQGLREAYDLILFDVPPSFNRVVQAAYLASDTVICPVNSDVWSLESLHLTIEDIKAAASKWKCKTPDIHVLRNKVAAALRRDTREAEVELVKEFASLLLDLQIKHASPIANCINDGTSIFTARGSPELKDAFTQLFDFLCPLERERTAK